jgi:hypothetical protein
MSLVITNFLCIFFSILIFSIDKVRWILLLYFNNLIKPCLLQNITMKWILIMTILALLNISLRTNQIIL